MSRFLQSLIMVSPLLIPLYHIRFDIGPLPTNIWEMAVLFLLLIHAKILIAKRKSIFKSPALLSGIALVLLSFISLSWSQDIEASLGIIKGWMLVPIAYIAILKATLTKEDFPKFLRIAVFSAVLYGLTGLLQYLGLGQPTPDGRMTGFLESANYLAMYIVPFLVLLLGNYLYDIKHKMADTRFLFSEGTLLAFLIIIVYFTQSYNALLSLILLGFYFIVRMRMLRMGFLLVLLFAVLLVSLAGSQKLNQAMQFSERSSSSVRMEVYQISGELIQEQPLTGYGLGTYEHTYIEQAPQILGKAPMEWVMIHPHNILLAFWFQLGVLGVLWFVLTILYFLFMTVHIQNRRYALSLSAALLSFITLGFFDTPFFKNDFAVQFFLILFFIEYAATLYKPRKASNS